MSHPKLMPIRLILAAICATALLHAAPALAQQAAEVQLSYSNGCHLPSANCSFSALPMLR